MNPAQSVRKAAAAAGDSAVADQLPAGVCAATTNAVFQLAVGYCRPSADDPLVMHSNCSSTLIRSKSGQHIVVDTLTPWHRAEMLEGELRSLLPNSKHF